MTGSKKGLRFSVGPGANPGWVCTDRQGFLQDDGASRSAYNCGNVAGSNDQSLLRRRQIICESHNAAFSRLSTPLNLTTGKRDFEIWTVWAAWADQLRDKSCTLNWKMLPALRVDSQNKTRSCYAGLLLQSSWHALARRWKSVIRFVRNLCSERV